MARLTITLDEVVEFIKQKPLNKIKHLNSSGNKLKLDYHFDTPSLFPDIDVPFTLKFARFSNNTVYLKWSLNVNKLIDKFLNKILESFADILSNLGKRINFVDGISRDGDKIIIRLQKVVNGIQISNIQVRNGTVIIEGEKARPSSGNGPNTKRYAEYYSAKHKFTHRFDNFQDFENHFVAAKPIAYHKNYYRFYPSCENIPIGDIDSIADLKTHWKT